MAEAVRRRARITTCAECKAPILVGLDDDVAALVVRVDPFALSSVGEVEAILARRPTYWLRFTELDRRNQWNIRGNQADDVTVLVEHRCGWPVPVEWRKPIQPPQPRRTVDADF